MILLTLKFRSCCSKGTERFTAGRAWVPGGTLPTGAHDLGGVVRTGHTLSGQSTGKQERERSGLCGQSSKWQPPALALGGSPIAWED